VKASGPVETLTWCLDLSYARNLGVRSYGTPSVLKVSKDYLGSLVHAHEELVSTLKEFEIHEKWG
jgi:hypothetical protein